MPKRSAGLVMYRKRGDRLEVFLVHPGGPFWAKKDQAAWSIPKGEYEEGEDAFHAAQREFNEETGFTAQGTFTKLGEVTQSNGKIVTAWAFEGDCDPQQLTSNFCEVEWPPKSHRMISIPEVDRGAWFDLAEAQQRIFKGQQSLLEMLSRAILGQKNAGFQIAARASKEV